jgi:hypothetical protein
MVFKQRLWQKFTELFERLAEKVNLNYPTDQPIPACS